TVARLKAEWSAIVGTELARLTEPDALLAGRGAKNGKALRLKVAGAAALEIQHQSSQLVERVNAYLGHKFVDESRLVAGARVRARTPQPPRGPDPQVMQRMSGKVADVKDPDLRAALARLGARIETKRRGVLLGLLGALAVAERPRAQDVDTD